MIFFIFFSIFTLKISHLITLIRSPTNPRPAFVYHLWPVMSAIGRDFSKRRNNINILFLFIQSLLPFPEKNLEDGLGIMPQSPSSTQGLTDHWGSQSCSQRDTSAFVLRLWFPPVTPRQWLSTAKALMALQDKEQVCSDAWPWLDESLMAFLKSAQNWRAEKEHWGQTTFTSRVFLPNTSQETAIALWLCKFPLCLRSFSRPIPIPGFVSFPQTRNELPSIINILSHDQAQSGYQHPMSGMRRLEHLDFHSCSECDWIKDFKDRSMGGVSNSQSDSLTIRCTSSVDF